MNTIAVILAGGIGKRFFPLAIHKALYPMLAQPIISHTVASLELAGFSEIVIVVNKENQKETTNLFKGRPRIKISVQASPNGMADALLAAEKLIKGKSIFVLNATDMVEDKLFLLARKHFNDKNAFIITKRQDKYIDLGYLVFSRNKLIGIMEKPGAANQPSNFVNLVFHYFPLADEFMNLIKSIKNIRDDSYEQALTQYIKNSKVKVLIYDGYWQPLKYPWHLLDINKLFLTNKLQVGNNASFISVNSIIEGNVYLGKGVKILENAIIKGPCYIGNDTVIGSSSLVIESMIGENCVIGHACEISRSHIGKGSWLHRNYIGDSILEGDNYFGAGAVTANFRFDAKEIGSVVLNKTINTQRVKLGAIIGKGARIGVNASLMPGVMVGSKALVGPGMVLYNNLPVGQRLFVQR